MDPKEYVEGMLRKAYGGNGAETDAEGQPDGEARSFIEGAPCTVVGDRYERNRAARQRCLEAHGATCSICGFDFAQAYGPKFAGIIQVHHIAPIHEKGEAYKVDPVHDLLPVCPNCHVALHSKPGGTYTPAELRALRGQANKDESEER